MVFSLKMLYSLGALMLSVLLTKGELTVDTSNNDLSAGSLYDNLLQREYAGPVVFPNHQVERKAQRSPSLRLRFGRRSDPDMLVAAQKRWFGDVHQKPIRSPSLRLRFGRRSDPAVPVHSTWDALMSDLVNADTNLDDYAEELPYEGVYERVARKPQRLRWGRSVPYNSGESDNNADLKQRYDAFFASLLNSEKLRTMLAALNQYDSTNNNNNEQDNVDNDLALDSGEFEREVRKPGPLRLRWGRSTGGPKATSVAASAKGGEQEIASLQEQEEEKKFSLEIPKKNGATRN